MQQLILASASPRRRAILKYLGYDFQTEIAECHEKTIPDDPVATVYHNAKAKARALRKRYTDAVIIAADTVVSFNGKIYGKPATKEEARSWLSSFSGGSHLVYTAVAFVHPKKERSEVFVEVSSLRFKTYGLDTVDEYLYKVTPIDRAGAYDINEHSHLIIDSYKGSYSNIMGLPEKIVKMWLYAHEIYPQSTSK